MATRGNAAHSPSSFPPPPFLYPISNHLLLSPSNLISDASIATGAVTMMNGKSISAAKDSRQSADFNHLSIQYGTAAESDASRAQASSHDTVCAINIFQSPNKVQGLVLPASVPSQGLYIANASSNASKLRVLKFGLKVFGAHFHLMPAADFKKLKSPFKQVGPVFKKSNIPSLANFMPGGATKQFVLFLVSNSGLAPFGLPGTTSGSLNDVMAAMIEDAHPVSKEILALITSRDPALGQAIEANFAEVEPYLPTIPPGCSIYPDPFVAPTQLTLDEEEGEEFGPAVAVLQEKLNSFRPSTTADDSSTIPGIIHSPPAQVTTQPTTPTTAAADTDTTEVDDILARFRLLGARLQTNKDGSRSVVLGTVDPKLEKILRNSTKSNRVRKLMSFISTMMKAKEDSVDYLERMVNWSSSKEQLVCAWVLGCIGNLETLTTVDELTSQNSGLTSAQFTRATQKQIKEHIKQAQQQMATRTAEDLMGVSDTDPSRTKVVTTTFATANITSPDALIACGANHVFMLQALCTFNLRGDDAPEFVKAILKLCDATSTAAFMQTLYHHTQREKFCYYVFSQFGSLLRTILEFASDETHYTLCQTDSAATHISAKLLEDLEALANFALSQLLLFKNGSSDIPGSPFWESSTQKRTQDKRMLADLGLQASTGTIPKKLRPLKTPEKPSSDNPPTPASERTPQADRVGVLICEQGRIQEPTTIRNKSNMPVLCFMHLRHGTACPYRANCSRSHAPIDQWPQTLREDWANHVKSTPTLRWNKEVVPAQLFAELSL